jgi:AcrR family transcriptional regulator
MNSDSPNSPLRQAQRDAATDMLLEAAEAAIARKGYAHVTMHDIAESARCATGTLYLYFKNKEELLSAIISRHSKAVTQQLHRAMEGTTNPIEKLRRNTQAFLEYFNAHKTFFYIFYTATSPAPGDAVQSRLQDAALKDYLEFRGLEIELIRQAQAAGLARTDLAPELLVNFMHGVATGICGRWAVAADAPPPAEQMRILWGLQMGGIGGKEGTDAAR